MENQSTVKSYKAGVKTPGDKEFVFNGLRFRTVQEAEDYGKELASRWMLVNETKAFGCEDEVSHVFKGGKAERLVA